MTVHTLRQVKALQRANARWRNPPTHHLQAVAVNPVRRTLGDRIADAGRQVEKSRITWWVIGCATAILYIATLVKYWPKA